MFRSVSFRLVALLSTSFMGSSNAQMTLSPITLDLGALTLTKTRLQANDGALSEAYAALLKRADAALQAPLESVTNKTLTPPSGDKHDYMSMGPYWWPNPATPNGLPYIRKDGQTNPDSKKGLDADRLQSLNNNSRDLALAHFFTGQEKYAARAAEAIKVWFLAPETRMNPHMRYGQAVPGVVDGRGIGLIDARNLWMVIDAAALIAPSGKLSEQDIAGLRLWFKDFADWMVNSPTGHEEYVWHNNHGTYYDAQLANYRLFTGDLQGAAQVILDAQTLRIAAQIAADGRMVTELERTRPFHYSQFNLEAALRLARYGDVVSDARQATLPPTDPSCVQPQAKCRIDVWNYEVDSRSLKKGIDFLTNVVLQPETWKLSTPEEKTPPLNSMIPHLLMAERAYKTGTYAKALSTLAGKDASNIAYLLWPLP